MPTEHLPTKVAGISVEVLRKDIKHLYTKFYPPRGCVRMFAPLYLETIRFAVVSRLAWIFGANSNNLSAPRATTKKKW